MDMSADAKRHVGVCVPALRTGTSFDIAGSNFGRFGNGEFSWVLRKWSSVRFKPFVIGIKQESVDYVGATSPHGPTKVCFDGCYRWFGKLVVHMREPQVNSGGNATTVSKKEDVQNCIPRFRRLRKARIGGDSPVRHYALEGLLNGRCKILRIKGKVIGGEVFQCFHRFSRFFQEIDYRLTAVHVDSCGAKDCVGHWQVVDWVYFLQMVCPDSKPRCFKPIRCDDHPM